MQPQSDESALGINPLPHEFFLTFDLLKTPGDMRIMLKGRMVADEKFQVDLFEPGPDNPSQGGMNADAPTPGTLSARDIFNVDMLVGEPTGSKTPRPGRYTLKVTVENGTDFGGTMGLLAQLELTQTCLNWGGGKKKLRGR